MSSMQVAPQIRGRGALSPSTAAAATVLLAVGLAVAPASPARANGICSNYSPALNTAVTCTGPGNANVTVPVGASYVFLEAAGAGGGASTAQGGGEAGGNAATVSGWAELPPLTSALRVAVGAGGSAGVADLHGSLGGGGGGGGSGVFANVGVPDLVDLLIAGGGGGAGGLDYDSGQGAGGDTTFPGADAYFSTGGSPGDGLGGAGAGGTTDLSATDPIDGADGQAYVPGSGVPAVGGTGATGGLVVGRRGGNGGGGFGGGGGGAASAYGTDFAGAGGGGGSSYVNGVYLPGAVTGIASGGAGLGATTAGTAGGNGGIALRFTNSLPPTVTSVTPDTGSQAGGGTITVEGTGLTGATAVTVGGEPCGTLVVLSATQLTCRVPAGAVGSFTVDVTTPVSSASLFESYSYTLAGPDITSVSPIAGPLAGLGTLTITGKYFLNATGVSVGGTSCDPFLVTSATTITCTVPPSVTAGSADVSVSTLGGDDDLLNGYRYADVPVISAISPTSGLASGGGTLVITGSGLLGATGITIGAGTCGSVDVVSATEVQCTIPSTVTVGAAAVSLTTPGGPTTAPDDYTYTVVPVSSSATPSASASSSATPSASASSSATPSASASSSPTPSPTVSSSPTPSPTVSASPTPTVSTSPTPTPTLTPTPTMTPTAGPTPTDEPTDPELPTPPRINLDLNVAVNSSVVGAPATLTGEGMRPGSTYLLTLYSTPVRLAAGRADDDGSFSSLIKMPQKACVSGGLHELVLTGTAADGTALRDSSWIVMDDTCNTRSLRQVKPTSSTVMLGTIPFSYLSSDLSPTAKASLRKIRSSLSNAKRVTVTGHTQRTRLSPKAKMENNALAKRRATTVRKYLLSIGVKTRVVTVGAGALRPLKGKAQKYNRRVEIKVLY
jgi:outer membrane protein OmpA-like peptidoglycan-associated protein